MSRSSFSFWFITVPDALLLYVSLWIAVWFRYPEGLDTASFRTHLEAFTVLYVLWLVVFFIHGLFETRVFRRYTALAVNLVSAMVVNFLIAVVYFYFQPNLILTPRRFLLIDLAVAFVLILFWHLLVKYVLKNRLGEGVYIFSPSGGLGELEGEIRARSYLGYKLLGRLDEPALLTTSLEKNSAVILPDDLHSNPQMSQGLYRLRTRGLNFYNHKDFYESLLRRVFLSDLNELWFLENINYREKRFYNLGKRVVDIVFGFLTFLIFCLTYPVFALLIKLETKGPALFIQDRVGKDGKIFKIYKYRTMHGGRTDTWTEKNDPRITRIGNLLRKTRIDELPQSINLLKGDLSLVGPRPEQVHIVERLRQEVPFYDERHLVKPGLTGWAQLNIYAGSLEETKLKLQYDLYYIKHRGFMFDLEIILKTAYYVFTWQGR